jgi:hypothetical protein
MFPQEWTQDGKITHKGPEEAQARLLWEGEGYVLAPCRFVICVLTIRSVYQMSVLEEESIGDGNPQGVVLALVGLDSGSPRESEGLRTLRMYSLTSLISLAKWTVANNVCNSPSLSSIDFLKLTRNRVPTLSIWDQDQAGIHYRRQRRNTANRTALLAL